MGPEQAETHGDSPPVRWGRSRLKLCPDSLDLWSLATEGTQETPSLLRLNSEFTRTKLKAFFDILTQTDIFLKDSFGILVGNIYLCNRKTQ